VIVASFAAIERWLARQSKRSGLARYDRAGNRAVSDCAKGDWASSPLALTLVWGVPAAAMLLGLLLEPPLRAVKVKLKNILWIRSPKCGRQPMRRAVFHQLRSRGSVMTYSGLLPTNEAIQQAVREPLSGAPRDHKGFAVYIFERARQIDHGRAFSQAVEEQRAQAPRRTTRPNYAS
jgi:hypothetical protein